MVVQELPVIVPETTEFDFKNNSLCDDFAEFKSAIDSAVNVVRNDKSVCCPSMEFTLSGYPKISGTYVKGAKFVNNRQWWRKGAFAIWHDGESSWVIGLFRNLLQKRYRRAFAVARTRTNCPVDIRVWRLVSQKRKAIRAITSCKCCNVLTVKGSLYVQNPKYGVYTIDGQAESSLVYKQRWPRKTYNRNFIYFAQSKFIISDEYGKREYHHGIEAETSNSCPSNVSGWKSWIGFNAWDKDAFLKVECANEYETCYEMKMFCAASNESDCQRRVARCLAKDSQLCEAKMAELHESCFYGRC